MHSIFVGRRRELDRLGRLLEQGAAGQGCLATLVGEAGLGKTRLLTEAAQLAAARGCQLLWAQLIEDPVAPPFLPWRLALPARESTRLAPCCSHRTGARCWRTRER